MAASFAPIIVTCMRPTAPEGEIAYRLKPDSAAITDDAKMRKSGEVSTDSVPSKYMAAFTWPEAIGLPTANLSPHSRHAISSSDQGRVPLVPVSARLLIEAVSPSNIAIILLTFLAHLILFSPVFRLEGGSI